MIGGSLSRNDGADRFVTTSARHAVIGTLMTAAAFILPQTVTAQSYPERPISMLVGFGPGGGSDLMARAVASGIGEARGYKFQIENLPGAAGLAALSELLSRPGNGYTVLQQTDGIASSLANGEVDAEFGKEILPVCLTQSTFSQIYARMDDDRFASYEEFSAYAHENRVTMANTSRPGTMEYILGTTLSKALDAEVEIINFDNPSERYAALLGGQVDILLEQPGDVLPYIEGEQFRPILTFLKDRPGAFPDTPALAELGLDGVPPLERIRGLFVRGDIPVDRLSLLQEACVEAYETEAYQAFNEEQFMDPERSLRVGDEALTFLQELVQAYRDAAAEDSK